MRCGLCVLYMRKRKSYRENCVAGYFLGAASTVQPQRLLYTTRIKENKLLQAQTHIALNWRGPLFECGSDYVLFRSAVIAIDIYKCLLFICSLHVYLFKL
jgi:hypothetical protein